MTLKDFIETYYRDREENLHKQKLSYENEKVMLDAFLEHISRSGGKVPSGISVKRIFAGIISIDA